MIRLSTMTSLISLLLWAIILPAQEKVSFEKEIVPLLAKRCLECHNARDVKGGLDLSSRKTTFLGGDSGHVIAAGKVADSPLIERLAAGEMPPQSRGQSQKLPADEIALLTRWIAEGAQWPAGRKIDIYEKTTDVRGGLDWWSLQPVQRPAVPQSVDRHSVDELQVGDGECLAGRIVVDVERVEGTPEVTRLEVRFEDEIGRLRKSEMDIGRQVHTCRAANTGNIRARRRRALAILAGRTDVHADIVTAAANVDTPDDRRLVGDLCMTRHQFAELYAGQLCRDRLEWPPVFRWGHRLGIVGLEVCWPAAQPDLDHRRVVFPRAIPCGLQTQQVWQGKRQSTCTDGGLHHASAADLVSGVHGTVLGEGIDW